MLASSIPVKIGKIFGASAGGGFITNPLPVPSQIGISDGRASFTDGFPPWCFQASGYPWGQDFNGLLYMMTAWEQWQAAGGPIYYDSVFSSAIGGYPQYALIASASVPGAWWQSQVDNNSSDPDTGGGNWVLCTMQQPYLDARYLRANPSATTSYTTHGTYTYTVGAGVFWLNGICVGAGGGGGGGGGGGVSFAAGGGASGGYASGLINVTPAQTITITVGQGGTGGSGGAGGNSNAGTGGTSSIGSFFSATGGTGGIGGVAGSSSGGVPGVGTGGQLNLHGSYGGDGNPLTATVQGGAGAASALGGGGRTATASGGVAFAGLAPGSGGGGIWDTGSSLAGGAGADGAVIIQAV